MTVQGGRLTMRATVEEKTSTGSDGYGGEVVETYGNASIISCFAWSTAKKDHVGPDKHAVMEDLRMIVALKDVLTEEHRITQIADRRGRVVFSGPLRVEAVIRRLRHFEVVLDKVEV